MKKQEMILEQLSEQQLKALAGGAESSPNATPTVTITIGISLAGCPTTRCASIVESCNG